MQVFAQNSSQAVAADKKGRPIKILARTAGKSHHEVRMRSFLLAAAAYGIAVVLLLLAYSIKLVALPGLRLANMLSCSK